MEVDVIYEKGRMSGETLGMLLNLLIDASEGIVEACAESDRLSAQPWN